MAVSSKHILRQGPVIAGLARTAAGAIKQVFVESEGPVTTPGPIFRRVVEPPPADLVRDYVRHVGGEPREYRDHLPPHLFPQWGFPLSTRTLTDLPYPLLRVMNGGCRIEINADLPADRPLKASAQLVDVDDDGRRAVLHQKIVTGTDERPEALVGHFYVVAPLGGESRKREETSQKRKGGEKEESRDNKKQVPNGVREVVRWSIPADAGLDFAKLTGDFNPIHWVPVYARASGFSNVILHGFSTMARAYEGLNRELYRGLRNIEVFDVQFTRPLVLPADVGLYVDDEGGVYVGDAPGGAVYMKGTFKMSCEMDTSKDRS